MAEISFTPSKKEEKIVELDSIDQTAEKNSTNPLLENTELAISNMPSRKFGTSFNTEQSKTEQSKVNKPKWFNSVKKLATAMQVVGAVGMGVVLFAPLIRACRINQIA
jgi:hypothetical protein